jgi:F-type H+-transporting ATPase subunit b
MIDFNYTILIQFANFLVLLILLNFLLFKPVLKALGKRDKTIGSFFEKAQVTEEEVKTIGKTYEDSMKEKKRPIIDSQSALLSEAHAASSQIIEKAKADFTEELSRLRASIEEDRKKAYGSLEKDAEKLSYEAAEKILQRSL